MRGKLNGTVCELVRLMAVGSWVGEGKLKRCVSLLSKNIFCWFIYWLWVDNVWFASIRLYQV